MTLEESVFFLPAAELGRRIRSKQLSPIALTEGYLESASSGSGRSSARSSPSRATSP